MRRILKTTALLAITGALLLSTFSGCSGGASSSGAGGSSSGGSAANGSGAASTEKIKVKILKGKAAHEVPLEQMDVWKIMGDKFNIEFVFDNPPDENFQERFNLVMVSNDLPDVIMKMPMGDVLKYAEQKSIIALNDLIDTKMPNLVKEMENRPAIRKAITYGDKNIYYMPMVDEIPTGNSPYGVREDWLKKLGLERPKTIADWENYWKLVKETDVNGNGDPNDEIPFCASTIADLRNFASAWGVVDNNADTFYKDPTDGKVHYGPIQPAYKEALTWMADMYAKGYIDSEIVTMTNQIYQGKVAQNLVGSFRGPLGGNFVAFNGSMPATIPGFRVVATAPPQGPDGKFIHTAVDQVPRGIVGATITSTSKNPDRIVEWIDYMYSDEGSLLINMGVEGKTYEVKDGNPVFTDFILKNPNGLSPKQACGTFSIGQSDGPYVLRKYQPEALDDASVKEAKKEYIIPFLEESNKYLLPGALSFDSKDDEERRTIMADVKTYVDEMIIKFISGKEPLSNWDTYVEKVKKMKIERCEEIYQTAIETWNSK